MSVTYEEGSVELSNQAEKVKSCADPATPGAKHGLVWQFVQAVAVEFPCSSKSNVCNADTAPDEKVGDAGKSKEPAEDFASGWRQVDESEAAKENLENDRCQWAPGFVDVR